MGNALKQMNSSSEYIIDSFPVAVCRNIRIPRGKLFRDEGYRGCNVSKGNISMGLKLN
jgi:hypothetical protein